jgi:hypothetical protein
MRPAAAPLTPLFRSKTQQRLLTALFLNPGRQWNLHELAQHLRAPYSSVHREATRLLRSGLLTETRVGQARLVRPDEGAPAFRPLRDLILVSFGAVPLLTDALGDIPGVEVAALYGSYAARLSGVEGPPPRDIDLLVIGTPDPMRVYAAARHVAADVERPVNPTIMDWDEWRSPSGFLDDVRDNPVIPLIGDLGLAEGEQ